MLKFLFLILLFATCIFSQQAPAAPENLLVNGHDSRIDLEWDQHSDADIAGFYIFRAETEDGPYERLNVWPQTLRVYSDFLGENGRSYFYYVTAAAADLTQSAPSDTLAGASFAMSDEELLTSVQEATFRYFYHFGHPVSGMARERNSSANTVTSGGTGFGLMALPVAVERGFVSRDSAAARALKIMTFLRDKAERYHGAWAHWMNGETGQTIPFSAFDDGGDLVETSYLVMGFLTIRQYFDGADATETELRALATELWEGVEWDWYRRFDNGAFLYWHWSPNYAWQMNLRIRGFNEAMIVYLLAIASPTHSVPATLYYNGWASAGYTNGGSFYGHTLCAGPSWGGPLFFTHYTFMGFDPRNKSDLFCNYFEHGRNAALVHREYAIENPMGYVGYGENCWGLTASDGPFGYTAHRPQNNDTGTITPTAALSSMPYVPDESIAALRHFYHDYGANLWGPMGFYDAFNPTENWFADSYLAIDQGPIIVMIENYRSQLCWDLFMSNPEIEPMLASILFVTGLENEPENSPATFRLSQNFPNPFNGQTTFEFRLPAASPVSLEIYNALGQHVATVVSNHLLEQGGHTFSFDAGNLPTGIYHYRLSTNRQYEVKSFLLVK